MASQFARIILQVAILSTIFVVLKGQTVSVNMQSATSDPVSNTARLTCSFGVDDSSYSIFNVEWRFGSTLLADFFNAATSPTYRDICLASPGHCTATRDNTKSDLVLSSPTVDQDQGTYVCQVTYDNGINQVPGQDSADLTVVVPTGTIALLDVSGNALSNGTEVELGRNVTSHLFTCEVGGINPRATFTWTLNGQQLAPESVSDTENDVGADLLTTSRSNATLAPNSTYDEKEFKCKAVNYDGDPGVMTSVTLRVEDPCDSKMCENGGTCIVRAVDDNAICDCTEDFIGDQCQKDNPCKPIPCKNGGTCSIVGTEYECDCPEEYSGDTCEHNPCKPEPCQNGGTCSIVGTEYECDCPEGYSGDTCEHSNGDGFPVYAQAIVGTVACLCGIGAICAAGYLVHKHISSKNSIQPNKTGGKQNLEKDERNGDNAAKEKGNGQSVD